MRKARCLPLSICLVGLYLLFSTLLAQAEVQEDTIPEPLKPWVSWVLNDKTTHCPHGYDSEQRICAWPSHLRLDLRADGGQFTQQWQIFAETRVQLPGNVKTWPQHVMLGNVPLVVEQKDNQPMVRLPPGLHTVSGHFNWQQLPRTLAITPQVGLVELVIAGKPVKYPRFSQSGQLWLTDNEAQETDQDDLDIQVFRKIMDGHPIQIITRIKLRVSGKQRNTVLMPVLPKNFIPLQIDSPLPARMQGKQQLQVQLRPGEWTLDIIGRAPTDQTRFTLPESQAPWPQQEVWVFQPAPEVRQVQVITPDSIDPQQTRLPAEWRSLAAYLLKPGEHVQLKTLQRGWVTSKNSQLQLQRTAWLDYDGQGYTFKDHLTGTSPEKNRLDISDNIALGRVSVQQQPQLITQLAPDAAAGVELRGTHLNLQSESRYEGDRSKWPVNGWQHDMEKVTTQIHLPAGWLLMAISGVDNNRPASWIQQWSLLDLFFVLLIVLSIHYLYNPLWAGLALLALLFTWHEADAPRLIWINLLAVIALLRVTPAGQLKRWLAYYRGVSFIILAIILLPYMIQQVKTGLYPQLNTVSHSHVSNTNHHARDEHSLAEDHAPVMMTEEIAESNHPVQQQAPMLQKSSPRPMEKSIYHYSSTAPTREKALKSLTFIDPDNQIQTGPGLPDWQGNSLLLQWEGPIRPDETSRLWLLSPALNLCFKVLGILLLLGLTLRLFNPNSNNGGNGWWRRLLDTSTRYTSAFIKRCLPILFIGVSLLAVLSPQSVQADDFPDEKMLQALKERLVPQSECLPQCVQIENMHVLISNNTLFIRLQIHAASHSAFPLPGSQDTWLPERIQLNHQVAHSIQRDARQGFWLPVDAGLHTVLLQGSLPRQQAINLPLPLKPHFTQAQSKDSRWSLEGINANGLIPNTSIQLIRSQPDDAETQQWDQTNLPNFIEVKRSLQLGLDWYVETQVRRLSPAKTPLTLSIPLLAGEQPMSESLIVKQRQIQVNLASGQTQASWSSRLPISDTLVLQADTRSDYFERWLIASSPRWNIKSSGLPISEYSQVGTQRVPIWKPWPEEKLTLAITRPKGIAGSMITLQNSTVNISTGKRVNDVSLTMNILSSRGAPYTLVVPTDVELQEINVDGVKQQLPQADIGSIEVNLKPAKQVVTVKWRENEATGLFYRFPAIDLRQESVNSRLSLHNMSDRWILWVSGPETGPVILFWGMFLVLLFISLALGYSGLTPLKTWQWFLLSIGLSQTESLLMLLIIAWLITIAAREKLSHSHITSLKYWQFNYGIQVGLVLLTLIALLTLIGAVANGLLGHPEMQIAGNGSSAYDLMWYQDRSAALLPQPFVISVPLWVYRILMLCWALWLAGALLGWLRWGWQALNQGILWRTAPVKQTS